MLPPTAGAGSILLGIALMLPLYAYVGYPLLLRTWAALRPRAMRPEPERHWPRVSITLAAYNEEDQIADTLQALLRLDYPAEKRQILVVSDGSTDRTESIVASFADRGVELLRLPRRMGKTAAENTARSQLRGDIVVNTDASIRIPADSLKPLIAALRDPSVGVASGRDISVGAQARHPNSGEAGYIGYEMWVRRLESQVRGIVGASGCLYAIRAGLHMKLLPEALSRDFAAVLVAYENGYRAVSVDEAICYVPRTPSLRREYRRKVRTLTRALETLFYKRKLLNPLRHNSFACMLWSHKVCRWLVPWTTASGIAGLSLLAMVHAWAQWGLAATAGAGILAVAGWFWPEDRSAPRIVAVPAYVLVANIAALHAWIKALRGELNPIWEPTRRSPVQAPLS